MSCDLDPANIAWNRALARLYRMPPAKLEHHETDVHDIASIPAQHSIQLGRLFRSSDRRLKRQKILHEWQHFLGMTHDGKARRQGYFSSPRRDVYSRKLLAKLEGRQRNPWFTLQRDRHKGSGYLLSYWILPDGSERFYNDFPEGPPVHVEQIEAYLKEHGDWSRDDAVSIRGGPGGWRSLYAKLAIPERAIKVQGDGVEIFVPPTEKQLEAIMSMAFRHGNRLVWDLHTDQGIKTGQGDYMDFEKALKRMRRGLTLHNPKRRNPWVDLSGPAVYEKIAKYPGRLVSYWIKPNGDYALFGSKSSYNVRDEWPIHGDQLAQWLGDDPDTWWPKLAESGYVRVQGASAFSFWKKPTSKQLDAIKDQFIMNGDAGAWDMHRGERVVESGMGSFREFRQALGIVFDGGTKPQASSSLMADLDAFLGRRGTREMNPRRRNPHQLFPHEAKYVLGKIRNGYEGFMPSNQLERIGVSWLNQRRLTWVDHAGFYHLNDRGLDAWMHARADIDIEMTPVPMVVKDRVRRSKRTGEITGVELGAAKPMETIDVREAARSRRAKALPPPPIEMESDLPVPDVSAGITKLGEKIRVRKRGTRA